MNIACLNTTHVPTDIAMSVYSFVTVFNNNTMSYFYCLLSVHYCVLVQEIL